MTEGRDGTGTPPPNEGGEAASPETKTEGSTPQSGATKPQVRPTLAMQAFDVDALAKMRADAAAKAAEAKAAEAKAAEAKAAEAKAVPAKPAEAAPAAKPAVAKPAVTKVEPKAAEPKVEPKAAEPKSGEVAVPAQPAAEAPKPDAAEAKSEGDAEPSVPVDVDAEGPEEEADAPPGIVVRYFGQTDVGLVREHNEDNFLVTDLSVGTRGIEGETVQTCLLGARGAIFAVCDGMGGAAAGEVASQMAVDTVFQVARSAPESRDRDGFARLLVRTVEEAGNRIFGAAKMNRSQRGMGTTATVAGLIDRVLFVGQVGDSRAYVLRKNSFQLVTKDQSLVNQLIDAGQLTEEEAEAFEHSNIILQALGTTEDVQVDLTFLEMRRGDRLLVCSDGLSGLVHSEMMKDVLSTTPDLVECCRKLIEMARNGGGHDNITVICAEFDGAGLMPPDPAVPPAYQQYPLPPDPGGDTSPARDLREGGRKVEGARRDFDDVTPILSKQGADDADVPVSPFPWWVIVVLLSVIAVATFVAFAMQSPEEPPPAVQNDVTPPPLPPPPEPQRTQVFVRTDAPSGNLFVDGAHHGPVETGGMALELMAGPHRLEIFANESLVVTQTITVREGEPMTITLPLPAGAAIDGGPSADAAADASALPGAGAAPEAGAAQETGAAPAAPEEQPTRPGERGTSRDSSTQSTREAGAATSMREGEGETPPSTTPARVRPPTD